MSYTGDKRFVNTRYTKICPGGEKEVLSSFREILNKYDKENIKWVGQSISVDLVRLFSREEYSELDIIGLEKFRKGKLGDKVLRFYSEERIDYLLNKSLRVNQKLSFHNALYDSFSGILLYKKENKDFRIPLEYSKEERKEVHNKLNNYLGDILTEDLIGVLSKDEDFIRDYKDSCEVKLKDIKDRLSSREEKIGTDSEDEIKGMVRLSSLHGDVDDSDLTYVLESLDFRLIHLYKSGIKEVLYNKEVRCQDLGIRPELANKILHPLLRENTEKEYNTDLKGDSDDQRLYEVIEYITETEIKDTLTRKLISESLIKTIKNYNKSLIEINYNNLLKYKTNTIYSYVHTIIKDIPDKIFIEMLEDWGILKLNDDRVKVKFKYDGKKIETDSAINIGRMIFRINSKIGKVRNACDICEYIYETDKSLYKTNHIESIKLFRREDY